TREPAALPPSGDGMSRRTVGLIAGGAGVVALGAGAFFGLRAMQRRDAGDEHCTGKYCNEDGLRLHDEAATSALVSTIAFGAGLAGVAVGAWLVATETPEKG